MPSIKKIFLVVLFFLCVVGTARAQILDDDNTAVSKSSVATNDKTKKLLPTQKQLYFGNDEKSHTLDDETAKDEALFNELFSDYSEEERDITKIKTFGDAMDAISKNIGKKDLERKEILQQTKELPPIEGKMYIGITKNSFRLYRNAFNEPACSFNVTLKSDINRDIKIIALNLVYAKGVFAFVFQNVKGGKTTTQSIRTMGDICYNLSGVPDIEINKCKMLGAESKECAQRLEWSNKLYMEDTKH